MGLVLILASMPRPEDDKTADAEDYQADSEEDAAQMYSAGVGWNCMLLDSMKPRIAHGHKLRMKPGWMPKPGKRLNPGRRPKLGHRRLR